MRAKKTVNNDGRKTKKLPPYRPTGTANNGRTYLQSEKINYRCTEGYKESLRLVSKVIVPSLTASEHLHRAWQMYCRTISNNPEHLSLFNTII